MNNDTFTIVVEDALHIPGTDILSIVGSKSEVSVQVGAIVSDGKSMYVVTSIPFIRHESYSGIEKTCIAIKADNSNPDELKGKTLTAV